MHTCMRKAIIRIWILVFSLSALFILLLLIGQPKAANRLFFGRDEIVLPGPIHVSMNSFPFATLSKEVEYKIHEYPFQRYLDIQHVYFNRDTVFLQGIDKPIPCQERFFCITNPTANDERSIEERIEEIDELPDFRGKNYKHVNLSSGWFIATGEVLLFLLVSLLLLVLVILYWRQIILRRKSEIKIDRMSFFLTLLFSLFVFAVHGHIIYVILTH